MADVHLSFHDRLDRITEIHEVRAAEAPQIERYFRVSNLFYPLSFVFALFGGVAFALLSRYLQFHVMGVGSTTQSTGLLLVGDSVVVLLVLVSLRLALSGMSKTHMMFLGAGAYVTTTLFHNLPHWYPFMMSEILSQSWVDTMRASTTADTLLVFGLYIPM
ncbi:hypothetical protein ACS3SW_02065 [Roseobacteraceae bacterium S113]